MRVVFILIDEIGRCLHKPRCTRLVKQLFLTHCRRMTWYPGSVDVHPSGSLVVTYDSDGSQYETRFLSASLLAHTDSTSTLRWRRVQNCSVGTHGRRALGGIVVSPNILHWAQSLNPVECCRYLGVPLKSGRVPEGALLAKSGASERVRSVVADATFLFQLCEMAEGKRSIFSDVPLHIPRWDKGVCDI